MSGRFLRAKITGHGVIAADGVNYDLLGAGARYGFDAAYAVREAGEVRADVKPAYSMPWPFCDDDIAIDRLPVLPLPDER